MYTMGLKASTGNFGEPCTRNKNCKRHSPGDDVGCVHGRLRRGLEKVGAVLGGGSLVIIKVNHVVRCVVNHERGMVAAVGASIRRLASTRRIGHWTTMQCD